MASFTNVNSLVGSELRFQKATQSYENLRTYSSATIDNSIGIATNDKFLAYLDSTASGACVGLLPLTSVGKNHVPVNSPAYQQPLIRAHSQTVQDFAFNPFHSNHFYTCSTDRLVKVWKIPGDGLVVDSAAADASFGAASKCAFRGLAAHPSVEHLLATRGSREFSLFDIQTSKELITVGSSHFLADIFSLQWSYRGDVLLATTKNKQITMFDPRANPLDSACVVQRLDGHNGIRFASTTWLGDSDFFLSFGQNSPTQERETFLWDRRNLGSGPVHKMAIDKEDGAVLAQFDVDTSVLVLSGKGDHNVRVYKVDPSSATTPVDLVASMDTTTEAQCRRDLVRGIALLPKQTCNLGSGELLRVLKLTDGVIQSLAFDVSRVEGYDVLAPIETIAGTAATGTIASWQAGENNLPAKQTLTPIAPEPVAAENESVMSESTAATEASSASDNRRVSSRVVSGLGSILKYRHMYGREAIKDLTYYNLQPDLSALDNPIISADDQYWAIPYRGGGGPVYVSKHANYGKLQPECITFNAHKSSVQEIAFSPFHSGLMATGSFDSTIKLWNLDNFYNNADDLTMGKDISLEPTAEFKQHNNSIRTLAFHPTVSNLMCSTSQDLTLRFFDVQAAAEVSSMKLANAVTYGANVDNGIVTSMSFNYEGTLLALSCKDRAVRIVDPRQSTHIVATTSTSQLGRNLRVAWCAKSASMDPLVTVCTGNTGLRQVSLWDARTMSEPLVTRTIDNGSGQLFPMFDEGLNVVYLAGKGDTIVRAYEIANLADAAAPGSTNVPSSYFFDKCCEFQTGRDPIAGICMLPKRICDVRSVEVSRLLKLTSEAVVPLHFRVPRAEHLKDFFHDDIYLPIRSKHTEVVVSDWTSAPFVDIGASNPIFAPITESMQPSDMQKASERPVEPLPSTSNSKIEHFKRTIEKQKEEEQQREDKFAKLQQMAIQNAQYHRNLSGPVKIGGVIVNQQVAEESDSDNDWDS